MRLAGGQERARRLRLSQPAPDEHLRQHVRAAEFARQPGGGRKLVGGDGKARVHDPEARCVAGRNRGTMDRMAPLDDAVRDLYSDLDIDGRVLDMGEPSTGHFDLPPDELVAGDPEGFDDASFDAVLSRNRIEAADVRRGGARAAARRLLRRDVPGLER